MEFDELKESFDLLDYDKKGKIKKESVLDVLKQLNYDKDNSAIYNLINQTKEPEFTFDEFKKYVNDILNIEQKEDKDDKGLRRMFDLFSNETNCESIDLDTLKRICNELGETFSDNDAEFIINDVGDGNKITYTKFVEFMKKKTDY